MFNTKNCHRFDVFLPTHLFSFRFFPSIPYAFFQFFPLFLVVPFPTSLFFILFCWDFPSFPTRLSSLSFFVGVSHFVRVHRCGTYATSLINSSIQRNGCLTYSFQWKVNTISPETPAVFDHGLHSIIEYANNFLHRSNQCIYRTFFPVRAISTSLLLYPFLVLFFSLCIFYVPSCFFPLPRWLFSLCFSFTLSPAPNT